MFFHSQKLDGEHGEVIALLGIAHKLMDGIGHQSYQLPRFLLMIGKGMAITGIICGIIPIIIVAAFAMAIKPIWPYREDILKDYSRITVEQDTIFADYEATGQIPDFLKKYEEEPFKSFLEKYDITIYKIMDSLMENHKQGTLTQVSYGGTAAAVIPANVVLIPFTA